MSKDQFVFATWYQDGKPADFAQVVNIEAVSALSSPRNYIDHRVVIRHGEDVKLPCFTVTVDGEHIPCVHEQATYSETEKATEEFYREVQRQFHKRFGDVWKPPVKDFVATDSAKSCVLTPMDMEGVREYGDNESVYITTVNDRRVIEAQNQGGHDCTQVDLEDVLRWTAKHLPSLYANAAPPLDQ